MTKRFYIIIFLIIILLVHVTCVHAQRRTVQEQHWLPLIQFEPGKEPATPKKKLGLIYFDPNGDFIAKDYDGNKTYFAGQNISIENIYEWAIDGNIIYVDGTNRSVGFFTNTPSSSAYIQLSDKLVICKTFTSTGINACIDALGTEGGEVYLPEGTYAISTSVVIDYDKTTLSGAGESTILRMDTNQGFLIDNQKDYVTFKNFVVDINNYNWQNLNAPMRFYTVTGGRIENVTFKNIGDYALYAGCNQSVSDKSYLTIDSCNFVGNDVSTNTGALYILTGDVASKATISNCHFQDLVIAIRCEDSAVLIDTCTFESIGESGFGIYATDTPSAGSEYSIVSNCLFNDSAHGDIYVHDDSWIITGNIFRNSDYSAFFSTGNYHIVSNNQFITPTDVTQAQVAIAGHYWLVIGNIFDIESNDTDWHINFNDGDNCTITANAFDTDIDTAAIYMDADDTGNIIYGNQNTSFDGSDRVYGDFITYGYVGIGTDSPTSTLHLLNDDDNANVLMLRLEGKRPTPANNDTIYIDYSLNNSTPASYEYARTTITAEDITAGDEEGSLLFEVSRNGTLEIALKLSATEIVINEPGADRDFRIEALGAPNALFIRGSDGNLGIGTASPDTTLDLSGTLSFTPSATQVITNAGKTILANAALVIIDPNNNYTLTSTPTIADGSLGQTLKIICGNAEANSVALQDQDSLAGSNLQLGAASRTISGKDVLSLIYDGTDWIEDNYQDN